jgi:hypothetical protein
MLVDIRAFPMSRRLPHFNRESLEEELPKAGIAYVWMQELGGRRKKMRDDSPNTALRNDSFRNYADYMMTEEFAAAIEKVLDLAVQGETAIMCAERMWFQCHRMLVSDYLTAQVHKFLHIDDGEAQARLPLMAEARLAEGSCYMTEGCRGEDRSEDRGFIAYFSKRLLPPPYRQRTARMGAPRDAPLRMTTRNFCSRISHVVQHARKRPR